MREEPPSPHVPLILLWDYYDKMNWFVGGRSGCVNHPHPSGGWGARGCMKIILHFASGHKALWGHSSPWVAVFWGADVNFPEGERCKLPASCYHPRPHHPSFPQVQAGGRGEGRGLGARAGEPRPRVSPLTAAGTQSCRETKPRPRGADTAIWLEGPTLSLTRGHSLTAYPGGSPETPPTAWVFSTLSPRPPQLCLPRLHRFVKRTAGQTESLRWPALGWAWGPDPGLPESPRVPAHPSTRGRLSIYGKGRREEASSSQGSRRNAGSLGTDPAVPGKARLWESHRQPPPHDGPPDVRDPSSPTGIFVRVGPAPPVQAPAWLDPRVQ
ncbi:PREDICTED: uncharacterized protein LOC105582677 [Cercocebus atys]|uniref:uncharacterized protein LOC105582677 n=1 Tax=Cercocebus atys TaxID=9531 RepID=UPI0005F5794F|nr:PREDICTED: uncharacterized protein LOC105582677 [Cercocebus atys]